MCPFHRKVAIGSVLGEKKGCPKTEISRDLNNPADLKNLALNQKACIIPINITLFGVYFTNFLIES